MSYWYEEPDDRDDPYDEEGYDSDADDGNGFQYADPTGHSALRAATKSNPRNQPCPTCGQEDVLTPEDVRLGYQCDRCADRAERGYDY